MSLYKNFGFNEDLGLKGKWFQLDPSDPCKFKIRYAGCNKQVREDFLRATNVPKEEREESNIEADLIRIEKTKKVIIDHILVDWKDLTWGDKKIEYSKKNAEWLFNQAIGLVAFIADLSNNRTNFIEDKTNIKKKSTNQSKRSSHTKTQKK